MWVSLLGGHHSLHLGGFVIACLVNKCYYVQLWLSYTSPPAQFQRQLPLGIVTHLPNPPSVLPEFRPERRRGYDFKAFTVCFRGKTLLCSAAGNEQGPAQGFFRLKWGIFCHYCLFRGQALGFCKAPKDNPVL